MRRYNLYGSRAVALLTAALLLTTVEVHAQAPAEANDARDGWRVGAAPMLVFVGGGPQASLSDLDYNGSVRTGIGLSAVLARRFALAPVALHASWSTHGHAQGGGEEFAVTGRSQFMRTALVATTPAVWNGRLTAELGGGVLHARSSSTVGNVGTQIGLRGAGAVINVTETAPLGTAAATLRVARSGRRELAVRAGIEFAPTEGKSTLFFPISLQLSR